MMPATAWSDILQSDEVLIWSGIPQQGFILRRSEVLFIPLALLLTTLAAAWEFYSVSTLAGVLQYNDLPLWIPLVLIFMACTALPFVLLGLFLLFGRYFYDRSRRANTAYALTNRRVIIQSGLFKRRRIRSLALETLKKVSLHPHPNGSGSIHLTSDTWLWWLLVGPSWWIPLWVDVETYQPPVLERINPAEDVYNFLFKLRADVNFSADKTY
ncbi:MAG: PH domain-containing protein [Anaerolineae bacterium]|nr:PH domain-containing protein [Anaerolineae bacterium]